MEKNVFEVLPQMLWDQEIPDIADLDYSSLYNELKIQTILGMSQNVLKMLPASEDTLRQQWRAEIIQLMAHYYQYMYQQDQVLAILRDASIPCFVLKGSAAAQYYPHPEYRAMGDIDIFIAKKDLDRAAALFLERNYHVAEEDIRVTKLKKDSICLELHTVFIGKDPNGLLDQRLGKALEHVREIPVSGSRIPVLPDLENGLVLIQHVRQHFINGLGLRQIVDWMFYVDAVLDDDFWYSQFQPLVRQLHLEALAITVTKMCEKYLGMQPKGKTWYAGADTALCDSLFDYLRKMGNFGRNRDLESGHMLSALLHTKSIPQLFRYLQEQGERKWELLRKYPWLKPFSWLRQIVFYAHHHFFRAEYSVSQDLQDGKQMRQLLKIMQLDQ